MKQYSEPKIKRIGLDASQAVLQVCKIGGAYFNGPSGGSLFSCPYGATTPQNFQCNYSPKGSTYATASYGSTEEDSAGIS